MTPSADNLLGPDCLREVRVGVSVSESADLARLGLMEAHFRLALGEIARSILVLGGSLGYGGHLQPDGYTVFLASELRRCSRRDRPLTNCLAWPEHRRTPLSRIDEWKEELGLFGTVVCLDPSGEKIDPSVGRSEDPVPETNPSIVKQSMTSLRTFMTNITQGRVLIGGKRLNFQGWIPGLVEEALIAIRANHPLFLAGGFGGVTWDMVRVLAPEDAEWMPAYTESPALDARCTEGLALFGDLLNGKRWSCLANGLSEEENRRLAKTHRPGEIAALVSLGLGRLAAEGRFTA